MRRPPTFALTVPAIASAIMAFTMVAPAIASARPPLHQGRITLKACGTAGAYCGSLTRALDPDGAFDDPIDIAFELYPHRAPGPALGTLVATEGGPGYPATESRDDYLDLMRPLMDRRDLLLMDNRGTGRSGAIDCHELQTAAHWTVDGIAQCGRSLGERAALFGTAFAADDLAAVLDALGIERIDLYGDSYGTYFEQVFATRHPTRLRSIILDGAYPLNGVDYAWYPTYAAAMRDKFETACRRAPWCAQRPGSSLEHIQAALDRLRTHPEAAQGRDLDGRRREFRADSAQLATVMFSGAPPLSSLRELDAAAGAYVAGDRLPLWRLMAETAGAVDSRDSAADPMQWSAGLAAAVMCHDPPQIIDMTLPLEQRARELDRVLELRRREHPQTYAPFTLDEYRGMPLDYSFLDQCVGWPVAPAAHPAGVIGRPPLVYPDVPALVISGEFDDLTTPADGAAVTAAFTHGTQVLIANSFHVNALPRARSACAAGIVRHFIDTLRVEDTACAASVPPLPMLERFARHVDDVRAPRSIRIVTPEPGAARNADSAQRGSSAKRVAGVERVTAAERAAAAERVAAVEHTPAAERAARAATTALLTASDVLLRAKMLTVDDGEGLRGGTFHIGARRNGLRVELHDVRWTEDLAVSGELRRGLGREGQVYTRLALTSSDGRRGTLRASWRDGVGTARLQGDFDGMRVSGAHPAP